MIHIVFQEADVVVLQKSFNPEKGFTGEVMEIKDDYAVGPLNDIYADEGIEARKNWWGMVLEGGDYDGHVDTGKVDDSHTVAALVEKLKADAREELWIWMAPNKHDVSGYYWLVGQLKGFAGRIFALYLNNLPFINEKGHIFYPVNIFEIPPREFLKARRLAKALTDAEFEADSEEWLKLINEGKGVRILEGGKKLVQHDYNYYDDELIKFITADWQKVKRVFHAFFSRSKNTTGDAYLLWRLKLLIAEGKIDAQGEIRGMKDFEVKLKSEHSIFNTQ